MDIWEHAESNSDFDVLIFWFFEFWIVGSALDRLPIFRIYGFGYLLTPKPLDFEKNKFKQFLINRSKFSDFFFKNFFSLNLKFPSSFKKHYFSSKSFLFSFTGRHVGIKILDLHRPPFFFWSYIGIFYFLGVIFLE